MTNKDKMNELDCLLNEAFKLVSSNDKSQLEAVLAKIFNSVQFLYEVKPYQWEYIANICLNLGKFSLSKSSFIRANNLSGASYVSLIQGNLNEAKETLIRANESPAKLWCEFLIDIYSGKNLDIRYPSFLGIRHFLETTIYYSLLAKNNILIQLIKDKLNQLLEINIEALKFIGNAYLNFGDLDSALLIYKDSILKNQFDAEVYYFKAKIFYEKNDLENAMSMLDTAIFLMPEHALSKKLRNEILVLINKKTS